MFRDVVDKYLELEPAGTDTWNPVYRKLEMWHRARLLQEMCHAFRLIGEDVPRAKILDVGCGVGRSTRLLLELGANPENVTGIDLRETAIAYAHRLNPAIKFATVTSLDDWPRLGTFDIVMQCTVFSSISRRSERVKLAKAMEQALVGGGHIIWWDCCRANEYAGGDFLYPSTLFQSCELVSEKVVSLEPMLSEALQWTGRITGAVGRLLDRLSGTRETHAMVLFRKPSVSR